MVAICLCFITTPHTHADIRGESRYTLLVEITIVCAVLANFAEIGQRLHVHRLICLHLILLEGDPPFFSERNVRLLGGFDEEQCLTLLPGAGSAANTVNEKGGILRRCILYDPVKVRNVNASRSNIGAEENAS